MAPFRDIFRKPLSRTSPVVFLGCFLPILITGSLSLPAIIVRGPIARIPVRSIRHRETLYIPVAAIARAYGLVLESEDGRRFVFSSDRIRLGIQAGSREISLNGEDFSLDHPVDWREGTLIAPIYLALVDLPGRLEDGRPPPPPGDPERIRIMLDPGHGGIDPGAVGSGLVREKDIVLEIARTTRDFLAAEGYQVILTRDDDRFLSLRKRARMANRLRVELFVSIHANAAVNRLAQGTETFYYAPSSGIWSSTVARLENAVLKLETPSGPGNNGAATDEHTGDERRRESIRAAAAVQQRLSAAARTPDRGVKAAEFHVLKHTRMPSILVETGFLSNSRELENLTDGAYRIAVAEAIARGIGDYLKTRPR